MTVASAPRIQNFNGSGTTGPFTFNFRIILANDGSPYITVNKVDIDGNTTELDLTADYDFEAVSNGAGGGIITTVVDLESGERIVVEGSTPVTQTVNYANQGAFFPETHERSFDKITLILQESALQNTLAIRFPTTDTATRTTVLPIDTLRANKAVICDADGNITVSDDDYNDQLAAVQASAAAAAASASASSTSQSAAATSASIALAAQAAAEAAAGGVASGYFTVTLPTTPTNGINLNATNAMGLYAHSRMQVQIYEEDATATAYWKIAGGTTADSIKAHIFMKAYSTAYTSCTMRFHTMGNIGQFHVYQGDNFIHFNVGDNFSGGESNDGYINVAGAHDGGGGAISMQRTSGSLNPSLTLYTAGNAGINFYSANIGVVLLKLNHIASGVNWLEMDPGTTGVGPAWTAHGETNVDVLVTPKGTGKFKTTVIELTGTTLPVDVGVYRSSANNFGVVASGARQLRVTGSSSAVNYVQIQGSTTGNPVSIFPGGSDANVGLSLSSEGTGDLTLRTNTGSSVGLTILDVAGSVVNHFNIAGSLTATNPQFTVTGSDTNIGANIVLKGTGGLGVGFTGAVTGRFHVKQSTGGTAIATFRDDSNAADLTIVSSAANQLKLLTGTSDSLILATDGGSMLTIDTNINMIVGTAAKSTAATQGFFQIQSCAGAPTGVPAGIGYSGAIPWIYDTTNNKVWFYNGAWRGVVVA